MSSSSHPCRSEFRTVDVQKTDLITKMARRVAGISKRPTTRGLLGVGVLLGILTVDVAADEAGAATNETPPTQTVANQVGRAAAPGVADSLVLRPPANYDVARKSGASVKPSRELSSWESSSRESSSRVRANEAAAGEPALRVAQEPSLLEKLIGPASSATAGKRSSVPPRRVADPPSLSRMSPPGKSKPANPGPGRWTPRRLGSLASGPSRPSGPDQPAERPSGEKPIPLTDGPLGRSDQERNSTNPRGRQKLLAVDDRPASASKVSPHRAKTSDPTGQSGRTAARQRVQDAASDSRESVPTQSERPANASNVDVAAENTGGDEHRPQLDYAGFAKVPVKVTRTAARMRRAMQQCLQHYHSDIEVAGSRSNWGMMHAMMVYGIDTEVRVGRRTFSTIAWIAGNNICRGQRIFDQRDGHLEVKSGAGLQGHDGQLLTVFSLCNVPANYPIYAGEKKFAVQDMIELEMLSCKSGNELTFILIGLSHYLDTDEQWLSSDGQSWDFERLIREELSQPVVGSACGGTHRLMGFGHALRKRRREGKPITGQWKRAEKFVQDFVQYTYRLQNRDGSFSTDWFEGRQDKNDIDRKVQTTGHMVEWLLTVTPDAQVQNSRLMSAVGFLLKSMNQERDRDWSIGPKGHALRSLAMFYDRVYQSPPPWRNSGVATRDASRGRR